MNEFVYGEIGEGARESRWGISKGAKFRSQLTGAAVSIFMKNVAVLAIALVHPVVKFVAELLARRPVAASSCNAKDRLGERLICIRSPATTDKPTAIKHIRRRIPPRGSRDILRFPRLPEKMAFSRSSLAVELLVLDETRRLVAASSDTRRNGNLSEVSGNFIPGASERSF